MDTFLAGFNVLEKSGGLVLVLLACILWGTLIVFAGLAGSPDPGSSGAAHMSLALAGWPLPLLAASTLFFLLSVGLGYAAAGTITLLLAAAAGIFGLRRAWPHFSWKLLTPVLAYLFLVFLRLGFVSGALLPPYFDSPWHYSLVQSLFGMEQGTPLRWPLPGYYHPGYHLLMAGLLSLTSGRLALLMLLFGQLVLAALPLPFYFALQRLTASSTAGVLGVALAALAWSMPAHAVNWGKYPALLGLLLLEFTLFVALLGRGRLASLVGGLASVLVHTRAAILLAVVAAGRLFSRYSTPRLALFAALLLVLEVAWIEGQPVAQAALAPYWSWLTLLVFMLALLAWRYFQRVVFLLLFVMVAILAAMFIPLPAGLTLLDRPLVQMTLFIPLALLGGLGAARLPRALALFLTAIIIIYGLSTQEFLPSRCCELAGADDLVALEWIKHNLPPGAVIGIASADVAVSSPTSLLPESGTDAGAWILPLTGRQVVPVSYTADFHQQGTLDLLCSEKVSYLYAGGKPLSFDLEASAWIHPLLTLPSARLFQVAPCSR